MVKLKQYKNVWVMTKIQINLIKLLKVWLLAIVAVKCIQQQGHTE